MQMFREMEIDDTRLDDQTAARIASVQIYNLLRHFYMGQTIRTVFAHRHRYQELRHRHKMILLTAMHYKCDPFPSGI